MPQPVGRADGLARPAHHYRIRVEGHLNPAWSDWFAGMTLTATAEGETLLTGLLVDQAALHGVLAKIRDLNLMLVSVEWVEAGRLDAHEASP